MCTLTVYSFTVLVRAQVNKVYPLKNESQGIAGGVKGDPMERAEEIARMREEALREMDRDNDMLVSAGEFNSWTHSEKFKDIPVEDDDWAVRFASHVFTPIHSFLLPHMPQPLSLITRSFTEAPIQYFALLLSSLSLTQFGIKPAAYLTFGAFFFSEALVLPLRFATYTYVCTEYYTVYSYSYSTDRGEKLFQE